jgi:hypothetical protein
LSGDGRTDLVGEGDSRQQLLGGHPPARTGDKDVATEGPALALDDQADLHRGQSQRPEAPSHGPPAERSLAFDERPGEVGEGSLEPARLEVEQVLDLVADGQDHLVDGCPVGDHLGHAVDTTEVIARIGGGAAVLAVSS